MLNKNRIIIAIIISLLLIDVSAQENPKRFNNYTLRKIGYGFSSDLSTNILNKKGQLKISRLNLNMYYPFYNITFIGKTSAGLINIQPANPDEKINEYFLGLKMGIGYDFLKRKNYSIGCETLGGYNFGRHNSNEFDFFEWDISIKYTKNNIFTGIGINKIYLIEPKFSNPSIFLRLGTIF